MWSERPEELRLLYQLSAELRVRASRVDLSAREQARLKATASALQKAIFALENQVYA